MTRAHHKFEGFVDSDVIRLHLCHLFWDYTFPRYILLFAIYSSFTVHSQKIKAGIESIIYIIAVMGNTSTMALETGKSGNPATSLLTRMSASEVKDTDSPIVGLTSEHFYNESEITSLYSHESGLV